MQDEYTDRGDNPSKRASKQASTDRMGHPTRVLIEHEINQRMQRRANAKKNASKNEDQHETQHFHTIAKTDNCKQVYAIPCTRQTLCSSIPDKKQASANLDSPFIHRVIIIIISSL